MTKSMNVMVVCGGISTEREVSLRSGKAVYDALTEYGYTNLTLFDMKQDNMSEIIVRKPDVVFLALHGKGGEDGSIQGMLDLAGIPYTGPGVAASAVCMDKILTKRILVSENIPTAKFVVKSFAECKDMDSVIAELSEKLGYPMVLKSPCQGSSIGVVIVNSAKEMAAATEEVFKYGDIMLAEEFLSGTEITLPVFGNKELTVLTDIEITSERSFYDYIAKYTAGQCHHIIPARISDRDRTLVREIGEKTYRLLNCRGLSRIDFIIDKVKGPMVIEVNTLPGMTSASLFPDAAKYDGISFGKLASTLVELALEKK